ncbi:hypothetical protein WJX73_005417 [Symbiochloris irregularis]|uniref:Uncharacterized protein n=1 Tax=Symbiochloris irregularis TaxID=706552 RepID=A0AAW1PLU2_9CHLO
MTGWSMACNTLCPFSGESSWDLTRISQKVDQRARAIYDGTDIANLGNPHRMACAALLAVSGLALDPNNTWLDEEALLTDVMSASGIFIKLLQADALWAAQPSLNYQSATSQVLIVPAWLSYLARDAVAQGTQELSAAAKGALGLAEEVLQCSQGAALHGDWMKRYVFCSILARFYLQGAGLDLPVYGRVSQLGMLFAGAYGAPKLLATRVFVEPMQLAQDVQGRSFLSGSNNKELEIQKHTAPDLPKLVDPAHEHTQMTHWRDSGFLVKHNTHPVEKAALADGRWWMRTSSGLPADILFLVQVSHETSTPAFKQLKEDYEHCRACVARWNAAHRDEHLQWVHPACGTDLRAAKPVLPAWRRLPAVLQPRRMVHGPHLRVPRWYSAIALCC